MKIDRGIKSGTNDANKPKHTILLFLFCGSETLSFCEHHNIIHIIRISSDLS